MKRLLSILAIGLLLFSCDPDVDVKGTEKVDVSFTLASLAGSSSSSLSHKNGNSKGENESNYPLCSDEQPYDAEITIDGTVYIVQFVALGTGETEVIQLPYTAPNIVEEVVVYDQAGNPIYESPLNTSTEVTEGGLVGVPLDLELKPFYKSKIHVDVVCYKDFSYETLTWMWMDIGYHRINTICFFGDICTKYFDEFHAEGSPYFGQLYEGWDFAAIFQVTIYNDTTGQTVIADNVEWQGTGDLLCLEYFDNLQVDEDFRFEIALYMPDGSMEVIYESDFEDGANSVGGDPQGFGGVDGIFTFNVGNCNSSGLADADINLPAYLPLPDQASFKIYGTQYQNGYMNLEVDGVGAGYAIENTVYEGWCGSKHNTISVNHWYLANVYSSLGGAVSAYSAEKLGKLNWIANHTDGYSNQEIQAAIWAITDGEADNSLSSDAQSHQDYIPKVGEYAFVIFDAIEDDGQNDLQLFIVRIDP